MAMIIAQLEKTTEKKKNYQLQIIGLCNVKIELKNGRVTISANAKSCVASAKCGGNQESRDWYTERPSGKMCKRKNQRKQHNHHVSLAKSFLSFIGKWELDYPKRTNRTAKHNQQKNGSNQENPKWTKAGQLKTMDKATAEEWQQTSNKQRIE